MNETTITNSTEETQSAAQKFAQQFKDKGAIILLSGNLGVGKTTFTQGFIKSFGITKNITSPTFLLTRQYQIPNSDKWIFHLDLYRLNEPIDLKSSGIREILDMANENIVLIEWSEKIKNQLKDIPYYEVTLAKKSESTRQITITHNPIIPHS